jgi:putative tricarboxylic transport membrane protein
MRINDAILGGVLLVFSLVVGLYARTFPAIPGQEYGASVFPTWISIALGLCSIVLIAGGMRQWAETGAVALEPWARSGHHLRTLAITIALVVFYILASTPLGFIPTAFIALAILFAVLGVKPLLVPVLAAGITMVMHYGFYSLLRVPLPWGVLTPWAW